MGLHSTIPPKGGTTNGFLRSSTFRVSTPGDNENGGANAIFGKTRQTASLLYLELGRFMLD
jgi:hypothetical protein